jgi:hypothetical protein
VRTLERGNLLLHDGSVLSFGDTILLVEEEEKCIRTGRMKEGKEGEEGERTETHAEHDDGVRLDVLVLLHPSTDVVNRHVCKRG